MRLAFQCENCLPAATGGAEIFNLHLLKALQGRGDAVLVLTPGGHAGGAAHDAEVAGAFSRVCRLQDGTLIESISPATAIRRSASAVPAA